MRELKELRAKVATLPYPERTAVATAAEQIREVIRRSSGWVGAVALGLVCLEIDEATGQLDEEEKNESH